jgi:hypothetical protein
VPVDLQTERRAMNVLDDALFNPNALAIPASTLQNLRYSEWAGYGYTSWEGYGNLPTWAYDPPMRHDYALVEQINTSQMAAVNYLFNPIVLQRIDENPTESTRPTMSIADLFDWLHAGIFRNLHSYTIPLLSRNLQMEYVQRLQALATKPAKGTPPDALALAQMELTRISHDAAAALRAKHDAVTQAHLTALQRGATSAYRFRAESSFYRWPS